MTTPSSASGSRRLAAERLIDNPNTKLAIGVVVRCNGSSSSRSQEGRRKPKNFSVRTQASAQSGGAERKRLKLERDRDPEPDAAVPYHTASAYNSVSVRVVCPKS